METIRDCKYGCGKKIKYDTVSFSDGFTVSIPWEVTAKGDLADIRMSDGDPYEEEHVPASVILHLGLKNFLDMLWLRDYKDEYFTGGRTLTTSYPDGRKPKSESLTAYRPILTDDEIKKITEPTLEPEPTNEEWRDGTKIVWDYSMSKAERKALLHTLKDDLQNDIEDIKKQYPEIADLQTPNAENKSFDKLVPADQQTLSEALKNEAQSSHLLSLKQHGLSTFGMEKWADRRDKQLQQYLYGKLIPRQRTDEEIKKDAERIQQDPVDEYDVGGKEDCELIITHDHENVHRCKMCFDKHEADSKKRLDMLHKEWDKKHPESTTTISISPYGSHIYKIQGKQLDIDYQSYRMFERSVIGDEFDTELHQEYFQFREEDLKKHPDLRYFLNAGDFEGALSHIQESINDHLHRHEWFGGHAVFRASPSHCV